MRVLASIFLVLLMSVVLAIASTGKANASVSEYQITSGNIAAKFSTEQVVTMLKQGKTCVKDGVRVLLKSKDITKKHCQKSSILGLRVIKAKNLNVALYKQLTGL
jgi:hypothetical protein